MADPKYPNRKVYSQQLDYRIFVVSAYQTAEITDTLETAMFGPKPKQERKIAKYQGSNYTFYKYAIEDYSKRITIHRSVDGDPATLDLEVFPVKDKDTDSSLNLYYKKGLQTYPIFRRMDYIEVQVAELTYAEEEASANATAIKEMNALLQNGKRSTNYTDNQISKHYKVRFRGFLTNVTDSDDAEGGVSIKLQAKSILHYLANSPFVSNVAMFNENFYEIQRAHLTPDNYVVLMGDLLTDLRDTSIRTSAFLGQAFQVTSVLQADTGVPYLTTSSSTTFDPFSLTQITSTTSPTLPVGYFRGIVSPNADSERATARSRLEFTTMEDADGTQASLIPLAELMISYDGNSNAATMLYEVQSAPVFNKEIQFAGTNSEFLSQYTYLLRALQEFKQMIKYFLYETANGSIHFVRPTFNGAVDSIMDSSKYISYELNETESGYFTEVFSLPGTALNIYEDLKVREPFSRSSGYALDELRRYGYRRPEAEENANINAPDALRLYSSTVKAINNAELRTLTLTIPYDKNMDLSKHLWFQERQLVGFVVDVSENLAFGEPASMTVVMTYLRNVTAMKTDIKKINLSNVNSLITVEPIPEFTFVSDFHNGTFSQSAQTKPSNFSER